MRWAICKPDEDYVQNQIKGEIKMSKGNVYKELLHGTPAPTPGTTATKLLNIADSTYGSLCILCYGTLSHPTDTSSGYAIGCIHIHTDGAAAGDVVYINEGTAASSNFDAVAAL
jgi:hypothetical protein